MTNDERFISYNGKTYPKFQTTGNASRFIMPVAVELCKGVGYDIGGNRPEWCLPGAIQIDPVINGKDGNALPETLVDYIFSSHCLEHFNNWVTGLEHWASRLKQGGLLLLYLPDYSQEYWRPWNNRKHKHIMNPGHIADMLTSLNMTVTVTGVDLNNSFAVLAIKNEL